MKKIIYLLVSLVLFGFIGQTSAQETITLRVQLIAADQAAGPSDQALYRLLPKLQRMPYKRFRQKGNQTVTLTRGKTVKTALSGHTMNLRLDSLDGQRARVGLNWVRGKESIVNITVVTQPGSPFVCGGPREGDLTWIALFSMQ